MSAFALLALGLGTYFVVWIDDSWVPNPGRMAEWRSCPTWLRKMLKREQGPVLIGGVLGQIAGGITLVVGIAFALFEPEDQTRSIGVWLVGLAYVATLLGWLAIWARATKRGD